MNNFFLCIAKDEDTYNHLRELNIPVFQNDENPINGFIGSIEDTDTNCDFYVIPEQYNNNIEAFIEEYFNKILTINDMQIYIPE